MGDAGPAGPPGMAAAPSAATPGSEAGAPVPPPRVVWKDRNGATVHVVSKDLSSPDNLDFEIADAKGRLWRADGWGSVVPMVKAGAPWLV
jgi:hypothetical protein